MGNKLQVFNRESNYLPERRSRFTTSQVFQHRRGVLLKNLRSSSTAGLLALMQELQMSLPGLGKQEVGAERTFLAFSRTNL